MSTTSPHQPPLLLPTTCQLHLEASSTSEVSSTVRATSTSVSTIFPRIDYSTIYHRCVDYSFVSTTSPRVDNLLISTTPYLNILRKYSALLKTSTMSTGYGPRILGRCRPTLGYAIRDSRPQETGGGNCGHASTKSRLLMARIGSAVVSCTLRTFDPANG